MILGVSTLAFGKMSKENIVEIAKKHNLIIEFSSSFPYENDMINFFNSICIKRFAHNYFPAPETPFVLNLGSKDKIIRDLSILHCIQGLQLAHKSGGPCFSAHAGFCIDPNPKQLGGQLDVNVPIDRKQNWEYFISSINIILAEAERLKIRFLIENNVTTKFNLREDEQEVLLCSQPKELVRLVKEIDNPKRFGLLLDTAHLKVSSRALNFGLETAINTIQPHVAYVHHSDNNGEIDSNDSITENYWFLENMNRFERCIHILEVKNINVNQIENQIKILNEQKYKNEYHSNL